MDNFSNILWENEYQYGKKDKSTHWLKYIAKHINYAKSRDIYTSTCSLIEVVKWNNIYIEVMNRKNQRKKKQMKNRYIVAIEHFLCEFKKHASYDGGCNFISSIKNITGVRDLLIGWFNVVYEHHQERNIPYNSFLFWCQKLEISPKIHPVIYTKKNLQFFIKNTILSINYEFRAKFIIEWANYIQYTHQSLNSKTYLIHFLTIYQNMLTLKKYFNNDIISIIMSHLLWNIRKIRDQLYYELMRAIQKYTNIFFIFNH